MARSLIDQALDYLTITWDDPPLKRKLEGAMERGKALIDDYAGSPQDYNKPGRPQALLFDYLRYVRSDATEMFEINYQRDLMHLRDKAMAIASLTEEAETDADC